MSKAVVIDRPPASVTQQVRIADVTVGPRHRVTRDVTALAESMRILGQLQPIAVTPDLGLIAGRHRLEAKRKNGDEFIEARILDLSDLKVELAEIHENLRRYPLSAIEECEQVHRAQTILRALGELKDMGRPAKGEKSASSAEFSGDLGMSERTMRDRVSVVDHIPEDVRDAIRETPLAGKMTELHNLSKLDAQAQRGVVQMILAGDARTVDVASKRLNGSQDAQPADDYAGVVDGPGDDVAERKDTVPVSVTVKFFRENPKWRKRTIGGEERYYRRERIREQHAIEFTETAVALRGEEGLRALCTRAANEIYSSLIDIWPNREPEADDEPDEFAEPELAHPLDAG